MNKIVLIIVLIAFSALTAYSVTQAGGILNLVKIHLSTPEGWQIFADLIITICLCLALIRRDAQIKQRPFWPWAIFSICVGSFGPLLYFITEKRQK